LVEYLKYMNNYKCNKCEKEFKTYGQLNGHRTVVHIKPKKQCLLCRKNISVFVFNRHYEACYRNAKNIRPKSKFQCKCRRKFYSKWAFLLHQRKCKTDIRIIKKIKKLYRQNTIYEIKQMGFSKSDIYFALKKGKYASKRRKCEYCHKNLKKNQKRFCNISCAKGYSSKHNRDKKNKKISKTLKNKKRTKILRHKKRYYCSKCKKELKKKRKRGLCIYCYRHFMPKIVRKKLSDAMQRRIKNGTHQGWTTRNGQASYPERFFIKVLKNNNLNFIHEFPIKKRLLGINKNTNYFLDFFFPDVKLNLEIDGKRHLNLKSHDKFRDSTLIKSGITVYRISWKNISTKAGKEYISNEIKKFLAFYIELKAKKQYAQI